MSATLPRPASSATATTAPLSLARSLQLGTVLEDAFTQLMGYGVISGGLVSATTGFGVQVASGTKFFCEGKVLTLSAAQAYNSIVEVSSTVYLWAKVLRANGGDATPTAEDSYSLAVTHNTTGTAPASSDAPYFLLAVIKTGTASILSINNVPDGKYLRSTDPLTQGKRTVAASDGAVVQADEEIVRSKVTINGVVGFNGRAVFV